MILNDAKSDSLWCKYICLMWLLRFFKISWKPVWKYEYHSDVRIFSALFSFDWNQTLCDVDVVTERGARLMRTQFVTKFVSHKIVTQTACCANLGHLGSSPPPFVSALLGDELCWFCWMGGRCCNSRFPKIKFHTMYWPSNCTQCKMNGICKDLKEYSTRSEQGCPGTWVADAAACDFATVTNVYLLWVDDEVLPYMGLSWLSWLSWV